MSSKQVQLSSLSPAEIKKLAPDQVQTLLLTVNINTLSYRQLQAFVMYLRLNKWTKPDFKANQKKAILLAEVASQVAAAQRQAKPAKAKSTKNKSKSGNKSKAAPKNLTEKIGVTEFPDNDDEILEVVKFTRYSYEKYTNDKGQKIIRFNSKRLTEPSYSSEDIFKPFTVISVSYSKDKGWFDAVVTMKSTMTYYDSLPELIRNSNAYQNDRADSIEYALRQAKDSVA